MTTQEAYEAIREFFSRPGAQRAVVTDENGDPQCVYREDFDAGSKVRCAVGCLIPDDIYEGAMERKTVDALIDGLYGFASVRELFADVDKSFLSEAQGLHDDDQYSEEVDEWGGHTGDVVENTAETFVKSLDKLAAKKGLKVVVAS